MSLEEANLFFVGDEEITRSLAALSGVGLDDLRQGQPATELSGERDRGCSWYARARRGQGVGASAGYLAAAMHVATNVTSVSLCDLNITQRHTRRIRGLRRGA